MEPLFKRVTSKFAANYSSSYFVIKCLSCKCSQKQRVNEKIWHKPSPHKILLGATLFGLGWSYFKNIRILNRGLNNFDGIQSEAQCCLPTPGDPKSGCGIYQKGLTDYTVEEISKHNSKDKRIWIYYKEGVYDLTDYLEQHPGGNSCFDTAAGGNIEKFWDECTGFKGKQEAFKILETFRIGNLKPTEEPVKICPKFKGNPSHYIAEPNRDERLEPLTKQPFAGGPIPTSLLTEAFLTPNEICYIHNHTPVPLVDIDAYKLIIEIQGKAWSKTLTLDDLKKFPQTTVTASMQCALNRSHEMSEAHGKTTEDTAWDHNAICTAEWTGVLLLDVLEAAGFDKTCECNQHVQFESINGPAGTYVTSIPMWRIVNEKCDVILAYEMNGCPLSRDHGYPLRVIIPGVAGTRWVKWLYKIRLQGKESRSEWQRKFKLLGPGVNSAKDLTSALLAGTPSIQETPVTSAICKPVNGSTVQVRGGQIWVEGYAYSGGGQKIVKVEISTDKGKSWQPATITCNEGTPNPYHWTWAIWYINVPVSRTTECVEIWARATDSSFNTQPTNWPWNFSGVGCNAVHKIYVLCKQ